MPEFPYPRKYKKKAEEPKCTACNDTGKVRVICRPHDEEIPQFVPCKDCQAEEPKAGEFTRVIRIYLKNAHNMPISARKNIAETTLRGACEIIDSQAENILPYLKILYVKGLASAQAIASDFNIPLKEIKSWEKQDAD